MSEAALQTLIKSALDGSGAFAAGSVAINSWSLLDGPSSAAPYAIIQTADDVALVQMLCAQLEYSALITLYDAFTDWDESLAAFQSTRDTALAALLDGSITVSELRSVTPVEYDYLNYLTPEQLRDALPAFVRQTFVLRAPDH